MIPCKDCLVLSVCKQKDIIICPYLYTYIQPKHRHYILSRCQYLLTFFNREVVKIGKDRELEWATKISLIREYGEPR
jgi:hypothetical protein